MEKKEESKKQEKKVYHKPEIEGHRYYERRALACVKNEDIDQPTPGCMPPPDLSDWYS